MPVRVLWVIKGLGPGGAENLLVSAARHHDHQRFAIDCAYVLPWKDHLAGAMEQANVRAVCLSRRRADRLWQLRLSRHIRSGEWDVVHVHSPLPAIVARLAVRSMPKATRPRVVSTEHNRWATYRRPTRLLNRLTSRWDDADIAVTDEVRQSMRGPAGGRASTVRHGIDIDATAAALAGRAEVRAEFGIGENELVVGTVANFRPQKDYDNLLAAARLLVDRDVAVRFIAVGQGPLEASIRALSTRLELDERVIFTGFRDDAVRVMGACDLFTLASRWEGLPVAVMEALALGLPIVATAVGGVAEELGNGSDALLVPPRDPRALADAIERVVTVAAVRKQLGEASRRRAGDYSVTRSVTFFEDLYSRLAAARKPDGFRGIDSEAPRRARSRAPRPEIREAVPDDRDQILSLLARSLGGDGDPRYPQLFAWKHDENRFGPSPMWVVAEGARIVAFRTFMRWEFERGGETLRAVRAVDTATDPDRQGRGLFRALTLHGLEQMRAEGVDFVFNTPNRQSKPGYLKMGWREVGDLPAAVRFAGPRGLVRSLRSRVPAERWSRDITAGQPFLEWLMRRGVAGRWPQPIDVREIRTKMDEEYLGWRFGTPLLGYRVLDDGEAAVVARARRRGRATELAVVSGFGEGSAVDRLARRMARLAGADYAIRLGQPRPTAGFAPLPQAGPTLTWRAVTEAGMPPLSNWALTLGDVELF